MSPRTRKTLTLTKWALLLSILFVVTKHIYGKDHEDFYILISFFTLLLIIYISEYPIRKLRELANSGAIIRGIKYEFREIYFLHNYGDSRSHYIAYRQRGTKNWSYATRTSITILLLKKRIKEDNYKPTSIYESPILYLPIRCKPYIKKHINKSI